MLLINGILLPEMFPLFLAFDSEPVANEQGGDLFVIGKGGFADLSGSWNSTCDGRLFCVRSRQRRRGIALNERLQFADALRLHKRFCWDQLSRQPAQLFLKFERQERVDAQFTQGCVWANFLRRTACDARQKCLHTSVEWIGSRAGGGLDR